MNRMVLGRICLGLLLSVSLCLMTPTSWSAPAPRLSDAQLTQRLEAVQQNTAVLKQKNNVSKQQLEQLRRDKSSRRNALHTNEIDQALREHAVLDLALSIANLDGAKIAVAESQQMLDATNQKIISLQEELRSTTLAAGKTDAVKERIRAIQADLRFNRKLLEAQEEQAREVKIALDLARQAYQIQKEWKQYIDELFQQSQQQLRQEELSKQENQLEQQQRYWLERLTDLNQQLMAFDTGELNNGTTREQLQLYLFEAQEKSNLLHIEIVLARLNNQFTEMTESLPREVSVTGLNTALDQTNTFLAEISNLQDLVRRKIRLIESRREIAVQSREKSIISAGDLKFSRHLTDELLKRYQSQLQTSENIVSKIKAEQRVLQSELSSALSRRQGLPGFSIAAWANLGQKLLLMPELATQAFKAMLDQIKRGIQQLTLWQGIKILLLQIGLWLGWFYVCKVLNRYLHAISDSKQSISDNFVYTIVLLVRRNITLLAWCLAFVTFFWVAQLSIKTFTLIFYLVLVGFIFRLAIGLAHILLMESATTVSGVDVHLYRQLQWAFLGGAALTMGTVLSHELPLGFEVRDFFNRLFMLFLLVTAIVLLRSWRVVPELLSPYVDKTRPYFMRIVQIISFLIPLTILSTALIGFLGYVDLAWTISQYEGIFIIVLSGYVLVRGLFSDFMDWLSELFIRRLRNGWLWTQAVLKPLDKIMRVLLIIAAIMVLSMCYEWDSESFVAIKLKALLNWPLITLEHSSITPLGVLEFVITIAVLFWMAKWTREFAYRWLFARTRDLGLRNSLAAFTQYAVVTVGLIISLNLIGANFTTISYMLATLSFGIGLGLRDIAKNYVSGFLLLIERPVRAGDLVSIGGFEGEVTHIGIRSMTVKTWDHMEVLVPNSETFDKPFTNWTHQDSIVRTVIRLRVDRADDPHRLRDLIMDALATVPEIVSDPEPQVFLQEVDDSLIEMQVRYFINLQTTPSRARVRSNVLFMLWDLFKAHDIKPPYPQQRIALQQVGEDKTFSIEEN